jgi:hypothetical protein
MESEMPRVYKGAPVIMAGVTKITEWEFAFGQECETPWANVNLCDVHQSISCHPITPTALRQLYREVKSMVDQLDAEEANPAPPMECRIVAIYRPVAAHHKI